jgi:hypothetical protein
MTPHTRGLAPETIAERERFNIENVEMRRRRAPPPVPQAWAKLASAIAAKEAVDEDSGYVSPPSALRERPKIKLSEVKL